MSSLYYDEVSVPEFKKKVEKISSMPKEGSMELAFAIIESRRDDETVKRWARDENGKPRRGRLKR